MTQWKVVGMLAAAFIAGASLFASPVPQAIAAVIATDVQCTGCVGNGDIAGSAVTTTKLASNSVNGGKVTDQSLSAADLGPDSVGASEIKGVTKLLFAKCTTNPGTRAAGSGLAVNCNVPGAAAGDLAVAMSHSPPSLTYCFMATTAGGTATDVVTISLANFCSSTLDPGTVEFSIIVYKQ